MTFRHHFLAVVVFAAGLVVVGTACPDQKKTQPDAAGGAKSPDKGPVVAEFKGGAIHLKEFEEQLFPTNTPADYERRLSGMLQQELLYHEGLRRNLDEDPQVKDQIAKYKRQVVINALRGQLQREAMDFSGEEVTQYYQDHLDEYEGIWVRQIFVRAHPLPGDDTPQEDVRAAARAEIESIQTRLEAGEDFGALAAEVNIGNLKESRGLVGPWMRRQLAGAKSSSPVYATALTLTEPGQRSDIIDTKIGFYILQLEKIETLPLDKKLEVKIRQLLARQHYENELAKLRGAADVTVHKDVLMTATPPRKPASLERMAQPQPRPRPGGKPITVDPSKPPAPPGGTARPARDDKQE